MQNDPLKNIWITYFILFYVFKEVIALREIQELECRFLFQEQKVFSDNFQLESSLGILFVGNSNCLEKQAISEDFFFFFLHPWLTFFCRATCF